MTRRPRRESKGLSRESNTTPLKILLSVVEPSCDWMKSDALRATLKISTSCSWYPNVAYVYVLIGLRSSMANP